MHIRQLLVAGVILFGAAQMKAGRKGEKNSHKTRNQHDRKNKSNHSSNKPKQYKNKRKILAREKKDYNNYVSLSFDEQS